VKTRIASSIALAAAILVGASGCALFAPQGTTEQYAPSDGIDLAVADVSIRNIMLVQAEDGENFNVVFTAVNAGATAKTLTIDFVSSDGAAEASAEFQIEPGSQFFGDPEGHVPPVLVSIPNLAAGQVVTAYLQIPGSSDVERQIPVLDGTLAEYRPFVLSPSEATPEQGAEDGVAVPDAELADADEEGTASE